MSQNRNFVIVDDKRTEIDQFEEALSSIENSSLLYKAFSEELLMEYLLLHHREVDYLIVDLKFADDFKAGFQIINTVHQKYKAIKMLICSEYPDRAYLQKVIFEESTYGFIEKGREDFVFDLKRAIKTIESGGFFWEIALRKNITLNGQMYDRQVAKRLKEEKYYSLPKSERDQKRPTDMKTSQAEIKKYRYQYTFQHEYDMSAQRWLIFKNVALGYNTCLLYTSPSPRDATLSRMPSSA